jgi:hypothetical protein
VLSSLPSGAVGSGLILLVIVAAWLAVLVPMALRSHDSADSLSSVDRFSDAMRVLSRRDATARARARSVAGRARLGSDVDPEDLDDDERASAGADSWSDGGDDHDSGHDRDHDSGHDSDPVEEWEQPQPSRARALLGSALAAVAVPWRAVRDRRGGAPLTPARRRRRLLLTLLGVALVTLVAGLTVSPWLLVAHGVADLLLVGFLVHLRRMVLRRQVARTPARVPAPRPASGSVRVQPVAAAVQAEPAPSAEPAPQPHPAAARDLPVPAAMADPLGVGPLGVGPQTPPAPPEPQRVVATAARHDEPLPVSPGLGAPWSPVPLPPPLYAGKAVAPRYGRTVDLTRPAPEPVTAGERLPGMEDEVPGEAPSAEPRRAVNDW